MYLISTLQAPVQYPQRYYANAEYWKKESGPVFLYIGGEAKLSHFSIIEGNTVF